MDKGSAIAEQNKRPSRGSSKRKRTVSDDSSAADLDASTVSSGGGGNSGESSRNLSKENSSASTSTSASISTPHPPPNKRAKKAIVVKSEIKKEPNSQETASNNLDGGNNVGESSANNDGNTSSNNGDRARGGLNDLVDYFPSFQLGRRLTRSLARQLGATSSSPSPSSSHSASAGGNNQETDEGTSSNSTINTRRRSSLSNKPNAAASASASSSLPSSSSNANQLTGSSHSAVKTGCHLSRKTHPSVGATSGSSSRNNAKVGTSSSSSGGGGGNNSDETKKPPENNNVAVPMEQDQPQGAAAAGNKKSGRSHASSQGSSTIPKHTNASGTYGIANTLIDLERDGGSSSSDSMDGSSSGIGSSSVGGAASGSNAGQGGGRLSTLLDARNLPMHIFGALGPRMQTLFNRCPSHGTGANAGSMGAGGGSSGGGTRFDSLVQGMQKADDPSAQLQALIELCNILVMSNEETLGPNFPVKDTIRSLIKLLQSEQSYDIMTHACRALTYLMEAAPRVTPAVTDAVPLLLDKLQRVECVDVAEQALAALDLLSRRHSKCILTAGGIGACLQYIDFFSLASQRSALQIVANCCLHMTSDDFKFLVDSLPALTQRLTSSDKKTVELVCVMFTRLVESYMHEPDKIRRLCDHGLLENVQQMVVASPPILSSNVLVGIIRMMHTLCRQCSELAVRLLRLNVVAALRFLLMGTADAVAAADAELLARTPQELYELVLLISELLPPLPTDGQLFEVDTWLKTWYYYYYQGGRCMMNSLAGNLTHLAAVGGGGDGAPAVEQAFWTWKDERGLWRPFTQVDNHLLETAYQAREEELSINTFGQQFTVDLVNMVQINEESGYSRPIQRKMASLFGGSRSSSTKTVNTAVDPRLELSQTEPKLYEEMVRCLLPVLYDIYTSVGGPAVRHECLRAMLRMIYHSDGELLLREALKKDAVSSLLAGMLNSNDLKTVVPALQLCTVLMEKLPDVFHVHFRREGVTHQLRRLANGTIQFMSTPTATSSSLNAAASASTSSMDGFMSSANSASSLGFGTGSVPSSSSVTVAPPSFLDRTIAQEGDGVGLNAINSVDQFFTAVSGLPLLRHHHHNRHVHHRQQGFETAMDQQRSTLGDNPRAHAATTTTTATSGGGGSSSNNDLLTADSISTSTNCLPPPLSPAAGASSSSAGTSGGAVPKRAHHHHGASGGASSNSSGANTSGKTGGGMKTRRAAAAAAITSKQPTSARNMGTRASRSRAGSSTEATSSHPQGASSSPSTSPSATNDTSGHSPGGAASSFFQSLPFPKWARGSGGASNAASTTGSTSGGGGGSSSNLLRQVSAPNSKSVVQQHLRQKQMMHQTSTPGDHLHAMASSSATTSNSANSPSLNAEKCVNWVRQQAKNLMQQYFHESSGGESSSEQGGAAVGGDVISSAAQHAASVLERLTALAVCLKDGNVKAIDELATILSSPTNVSCFELLQSGLIGALTEFLARGSMEADEKLRAFCKAFFGVQSRKDSEDDSVSLVYVEYPRDGSNGDGEWTHPARLLLSKLNVCVSQLEQFPVKVHDLAGTAGGGGLMGFGGSGAGVGGPGGMGAPGGGPFGLIGQLSGVSGGAASLRGLSALRFLHSQQIKCHLQRHPEEKRLKQWRRGPIKIDPLAQVVTIEKYLLTKGFGRRCNSANEEMSGDDDESTDDDDEDDEETPALFLSELSDGAHRLQILINDKVLPYDMTIYQAVRQYGLRGGSSDASGVGGSTHGAGSFTNEWLGPEVWIHTHLLTYRLVPEAANKQQSSTSTSTGVQETGASSTSSSSAGQKSNAGGRGGGPKSGSNKLDKASPTTSGTGADGSKSTTTTDISELKESVNPLIPYLTVRLPPIAPASDMISAAQPSASSGVSNSQQSSSQDPSFECINLIRVIFGLSRYWWVLYKDSIISNFHALIPLSEFHNTKLSAKVGRQLQDPLTVVAGQLPNWIEHLTNVCAFLFPFEVRLAVFHVVALDRDRALQRLLDSSGETGGGGGGSERITPRLERRKVLVNRDDLLKQAETVLGTMEGSRAVLEVQYENEVGTGLGPTLEFYALVSRHFQRADLQLWRGLAEENQVTKSSTPDKRDAKEVLIKLAGSGGLCPMPLGRHVKSNSMDKIIAKFRLLGKFLGRSLLDGRILDLPLSMVFYKWLLKDENTLSWADLADLDPTLHRSVQYLQRQLYKSGGVLIDSEKDDEARKAVESMELDFTVPGYPLLELVKNGKDKLVTLDNLQQYLVLLLHWLLRAGVSRQMEAVRDSLNALIPLKHLRLFFPEELDQLFCGARSEPEAWEASALLQALRPDHGYNHDSAPVRWLVDILANRFDDEHRRQFIQFITGSPRLPVGGLKNLNPPLTVVRKTDASNSGNPDVHLPSVMTCVNYLKLPEYSTREMMEQRLLTAITHGRYSFHLS